MEPDTVLGVQGTMVTKKTKTSALMEFIFWWGMTEKKTKINKQTKNCEQNKYTNFNRKL